MCPAFLESVSLMSKRQYTTRTSILAVIWSQAAQPWLTCCTSRDDPNSIILMARAGYRSSSMKQSPLSQNVLCPHGGQLYLREEDNGDLLDKLSYAAETLVVLFEEILEKDELKGTAKPLK